MDFNPFDINHNGSLDPIEIGIGASFIGSIGYGAGLSEAEEREYKLRDEYEEKLSRKNARIEELEDELDELRKSRYDRYDYFDYLDDDYDDDYDDDDDDDYDDDYDDDDDDDYRYGRAYNYDDDDYSYLSFLTTPNTRDLEAARKFGPNIDFEPFESEYPYEDKSVCFDFRLNKNVKAGYGMARAEQAKAYENIGSHLSKEIYVAGIPYEGRVGIWLSAVGSGSVDIQLKREPKNEHDSNAIAVFVNGKHGGYIPAQTAKVLAPVLDAGGIVKVADYDISTKADAKSKGKPKVDVHLNLIVADKNGEVLADKSTGSGKKAKKRVPSNTYKASDEVLKAIDGPASELFGKLKGN